MSLSQNKPGFTDKRTRKKIDLHLRDINDEITEKDIALVKTDVTAKTDNSDLEAETEAAEILRKKEIEDNEKDNDEDGNNSNSVETPWNILK